MSAPFARLLANIVVMGTGVLGRAFVEAYKQALASMLLLSKNFRLCVQPLQ